jgi:hypothetical protein
MCDYCEPKFKDTDGELTKRLFDSCHTDVTTDGIRIDPLLSGTMAQIIDPNPISKRRHHEDGLKGELQVLTEFRTDEDADQMDVMVSVPIAYCPFCGRKL